MTNKNFSYYLSKFLKEYLIIERNSSNNTIKSYTKTFQLLIDYFVNIKNKKLKEITFDTVTLDDILDFLKYLEDEKGNSISTRNQRLGAIKSFYQFCAVDEINNFDSIRRILSIKNKRAPKTIINYLTEEELKSIFDSIDISNKFGRRNLMLLSLLYDTAARSDEIIKIKSSDINLESKIVILNGKGNKQRAVPIMEDTKELIINYINENKVNYNNYIFSLSDKLPNHNFVADIIDKYSSVVPNKKLSPHVFRHTRAVHLLDKGVNIMYIKELLGHVSIETTQIYATIIEKHKLEAIEKATPECKNINLLDWNNDEDLLKQLLNL